CSDPIKVQASGTSSLKNSLSCFISLNAFLSRNSVGDRANRSAVGADLSAIIGINPTKSSSTSVGARAVERGREGLHGRPRPVALAHILEEHDCLPSTGDHKGPPSHPSS